MLRGARTLNARALPFDIRARLRAIWRWPGATESPAVVGACVVDGSIADLDRPLRGRLDQRLTMNAYGKRLISCEPWQGLPLSPPPLQQGEGLRIEPFRGFMARRRVCRKADRRLTTSGTCIALRRQLSQRLISSQAASGQIIIAKSPRCCSGLLARTESSAWQFSAAWCHSAV